jgi:hypothetical protein
MTPRGRGSRIPPCAIDAEEQLLGAMLLPGNAIDVAVEVCQPEDFYKPAHGHIFQAIVDLAEDGAGVSVATVRDQLDRSGLIDSIGGAAILVELMAKASGPKAVRRHAEILRERATSRALIGVGAEIEEAGWNSTDPIDVADRSRSRIDEIADRVSGAWDDPLPLPGMGSPPAWPAGLGEVADRYVAAVAAATATPPDLAGMTALGVASSVVAGAVAVEGNIGWREQSNLYLIPVARPGEGKTPPFAAFTRPLGRIERERRKAAEPAIAEARSKKETAEARRKHLQDKAAKAGEVDRDQLEAEAIEAAKIAAAIAVPASPRLFTKEATPEALLKRLEEQGGRFAVMTDEGAEFFELASRYNPSGKNNLGVYLAGHDGLPYTSDRVGRETIFIDRALLTVMLMAQPVVVAALGRDRQAKGRGLFARFLWSVPTTNLGDRDTHRPGVPDDLADRWDDLICQLADQAATIGAGTVVLGLDPDAKRRFDDWHAKHEPRLRPNYGDLDPIVEWAAKLPGQVLRLAAVLKVLRTGVVAGRIDDATMTAAIDLADYFTHHALIVFGQMGCDDATEDARAVLRWLTERRARRLATRDLVRSKEWMTDRARDALTVLDRYGWVRRAGRKEGPGRPSEHWDVHRYVWNPPDKTRQNVFLSGFVGTLPYISVAGWPAVDDEDHP